MDQSSEIINVLLSYEVINQEQLDSAAAKIEEVAAKQQEQNQGLETRDQTVSRLSVEEALVQLNFITWEHVAAALSQISGIPYVKLESYELNEELVTKIPEKLAKRHNLIAIQQDEDKLVVAITNPNNIAALDDISLMLGFYVEAVIAPRD